MPEWEITSEDRIETAPGQWEIAEETPSPLTPGALARSTTELTGLAGIQVEPETFVGRVMESWETGELQAELGVLRYRQIIGEELPEIETRIKEIRYLLPKQPPIKRGLPERAVRAAAEMLPIQISGMRKGAQRGLTLGLGAAAIAAVAGQIGPQAALPEEIITVPSAFTAMYGVGMVSGTLENIAQIEAGLAYDELLNLKDARGNRLDPSITKSAAAGVGIINGLIELAQIKLLLKTIPGGEALLRGAIRKATKKVVRSKTLQSLAFRAARRHAVFVTGETAQEIAQESTNILANETAKFFSNEIQKKTDIPYATRQEIIKRLLETAEQSALAFTVMGAPGQVAQITGEVIRPEVPIPVKAELIEKGMPEEEVTEPTIVRQQKVAERESEKQTFLTNLAQDVANPDMPITAADVAFMGQMPLVRELGITQGELNKVAAKAIQATVATAVTKDVVTSGERIFVPEPEILEYEIEEVDIIEEEIPAEEVTIVEPKLKLPPPWLPEETLPAIEKPVMPEEEIEKLKKIPVEEAELEPVPTAKEIAQAAKETEPKPTEAQIEADNYKKGHIKLYGFDISIETAKGGVRSGVDRQGKKWSITMQHHYGDILGTKGKDKDHLDVFIGPKPESNKVFVVDQTVPETGKFDEHKIMMGFETEEEAQTGYLANYEKGWKGLGAITEFTVDEFKTWTKEADTTKPLLLKEEKPTPKKPEVAPEPEKPKPTVFEIGDYVIPIRDKDVLKPGKITHIQKDYDTGKQKLRLEGRGPHWNASDYELAEKKPSKEEIEAEAKVVALRDIFDSLDESDKAGVRGGLFPPTVTKYNLNRDQLAEMIRIAMAEKKPKAEERPAPVTKEGKALKERVERERAEREKPTKPLTKPPKEPTIKEKEGEERAEEKPRILREVGEKPLEGAAPEYVPGAKEERPPGERPSPRPREDFGGYDESDIRARPEGVRGLGDGEGKVRPSPERGRPAELGRQHASGRNYRITDADALEEGGPVAKYDRNITAINLLKTIEGENRPATPEEQVTLVKYVGWGGLPEAFTLPGSWKDEKTYTPKEKRAKDLENLLTDEEYESARKSTPNAHFTSPLVINHIYDALKWMGFDGGRIIEPSMGIGHFFGRMPGDWKTKLVGVEIDSISGRIANLLYPDADVRIQGYEETKLPNNFFDLAVSNVPFGDYKIYDPDYAKLKFFIHDYFFAKSLDKVRPGGLVAFITSAGMMNKKDARIRRYIADRAELIAAIRLPNNTFKKIANTEVTTDIVFLRKLKEGEKPKGAAWLETKLWKIPSAELPINEYFHRYPHMQLGKVVSDKLHYGRAGLESDGRDLGEALKEAIETAIPTGLYEKIRHKATTETKNADMVPAPEHIKNFGYFEKEKKIYQKQGDQALPVTLDRGQYGRMKDLISLRDKVRETLHNQLENKEDLLGSDLKTLNKLYDAFVKKYGFLHTKSNVNSFEGDPDRPLLLSLEHWDFDKKTATKADIFRQRTMAKYVPVEKVETAQDALIAVLFDRGQIDFAYMSKISGKTEGALKAELKGLIFLDPEKDSWQTAEEYLSGNVRTKLVAAKAAAEIDPKYKGNVEALKKAQPEDKKPSQITARLGANWIPEADIKEFLSHLLKATGYTPRYIPVTSQWVLEREERWGRDVDDILNEQKWGIPGVDALSLVTDALNLKIPTLYKTIELEGQEKRIIDRQKTILAQAKQQEIKEEFERWIWEDTERRDRLAKIYNEKFNNIRLRKYDGEHLPDRLPGMAMGVALRAHQKDNTWRIIQGKNTLLAQVVGSGKTLSMAAAAMELKRLGLAKKPLFVVPKHLLKSWESEFLKFYPAAKILVPEEKSLTPEKRQEFMAQVTTGDWDAVIITHPNMMKLPVSKRVQNDFIRGQIAELGDALQAEEPEGGPKSRTVKELEKAKRRLEEKLEKMLAAGEKDTGVTFEELGVDYMFIDESHNFKNLWFSTRMTRVAGVQSSDVDKTTDLFLKSRYLTNLNNGRGVVFATGTPISNSMAEMYTIQRYLDMDALRDLDIHNFDAWAATFGEIAAELEVTPTGSGFRVHTRFRNFVNMDQLSTLFRDFADVLHAEDLPHLPVPKVKGGKPTTVKADISPEQKAYVVTLEERMEKIRSGAVDPRVDNPLVVTGDGTKAALDMRLIDPNLPDNPQSKVNLMVNGVLGIYKSTTENKSTQLVFCDFSTPKRGVFNVYYDVRDKLIQAGVPKEEIAFIHDYPKDDQKLGLFQKVRQGDIRILMGSSKKMGEGMNVQNRIVAVHHVDAPWTPASVEQRDGRAIRPGNENDEVAIYRYVTQSTFDAYRWQILENKAKFINQAMKGGLDTVEDIGRTVIDYATAKAIAADNPIVMEKVKVESDLRKYQAMHRGWRDQRYTNQRKIDEAKNYLKIYQGEVESVKADLQAREPKPEDKDFSIRFHAIPQLGIKDSTFTDKKEAGKELVKAFGTEFEEQLTNKLNELPLFTYRGFKFSIKQSLTLGEEKFFNSIVEGGRSLMRFWAKHPTLYLSEESAASTYIQEINKVTDQLDQKLTVAQYNLDRYSKKSKDLTQWLKDNPEFEQMDKLKELQKRVEEINAQLRETNKPVEQVPEVTPGQYYEGTAVGYTAIAGKKVEIMPWIDTFIHKLEDGTWAISEATTGLQITGHNTTQEEAKDAAWTILNRQGQKKVEELIAENITERGLSPWRPEGETRLAIEPTLAAEPAGYRFTKRQQKDLIRIGTIIPAWLKRAGADEEILNHVTIELKPFIDLRGKNIDRTLKDWEKEGINAGTILGATTFGNYHALIQLAINGQNLAKLEESTYHEWYHVAKGWMLPRNDIEALAKHFKTEESEAGAFAKYMIDSKTIEGKPGLVKRLFLKLKRMINIIRNGLKGMGFNRPEDIFGLIQIGAYRPIRMRSRKEVETFLARVPGFFKAVAIRLKDGTVYEGEPGEIHLDVVDKIPIKIRGAMHQGFAYEDMGFIDQKGKFYSRAEASIAVGEFEARAMGAKGLMPETQLAMEKKPPVISKEKKAAEEYVQKALGKIRETKIVELKPTEEITGAAYDKIVEQEAQKPIDELIEQANNDERLIYHVRSTLKKALSIGKKEGIAKQKTHYQQVVARAKARKEHIAKIRKMVEGLKKVDIEKLSPQEKEPVGDLLAGINLVKPAKKVKARLTATRKYLEDNPDAEVPEYVMESLKRLDKTNIRDMSLEEIEGLYIGVMHYVHLNKLKGIIKVRRENRRKADVLSSSIEEMKDPKKVKSDIVSSQKGKLGKLKKTAKLITDTFGIRHDHYDLIIESLAGPNSTMDKVLYQGIKDGITEQLKYKQETYAQFAKKLGDFSAKYGVDDIGNWLNEEVTTGKFQLTRGERMTLLRHALNRDNLRHLLAGGFGFRTSETPNRVYKITSKELLQILKSLTPAEKHFGGPAVDNLFDAQYERLNKVFYKKNNYELPKTKDPYYPIEVMPITLGKDLETEEALATFKGTWTRLGIEKGMLERRVESKKPIYLNSIAFDINRSVMKTAAYIGLEIPLSNASKLLYDQTFRAELEDRYGKQTWREIEKGLRDIAGDYQSYTTVEKGLLKLKNNLAVAMLGVNPSVMVKQVLSLPIYLPYVKAEYLLQGMIDFTVHPIELGERHKMYSPEYLERVEGGYSRDVADVFKGAAMKRLYAGKTTIKEKFMGGIQLFDRTAVSVGMQGAVLQVLDEFDQGKLSREPKIALDIEDAAIAKLTAAEKMNLAYKFADYATERTQPMFSPEHRSSLSRGATIEKLATMFGAFTNQALNLMRRTYREARRTGEPAAYTKLAKVLFLILVVNTLGVMAIDEIRDRLTKKKKRPSFVARILNTWSGYMFFVRDLVNSVVSKVERGTFLGYDVQLPIQRVPELLSNAIANGVKALTDETSAKRKKAAGKFVDDALNLLLMTQGIPYQTPKRLIAGTIKREEGQAKY